MNLPVMGMTALLPVINSGDDTVMILKNVLDKA